MRSLGFIIANIVPTARFAQLIAGSVLYPLVGVSGLFTPIDYFPIPLKIVAEMSPITHAVSLTTGIWQGHPWTGYWIDTAALSSRIFRWE